MGILEIKETHEYSVHSQNGEDGIIDYIFSKIDIKNKILVEIGVNLNESKNSIECNTLNFILNNHCFGYWIDATDLNRVPKRCCFEQQFVTSKNIISTFEKLKIPKEFELLSIDIDSNDYHIREALKDYRPRVCIMEYNGTFTANEDYIMPENYEYHWKSANQKDFGASLLSLTDQADRLGYDLVYCDKNGVNAFFIRKDINCFKIKTPEEAWSRVIWDR